MLRFLRWMLIPVLLLDALLINGFVRYGFPIESVPVEGQQPALQPGEAVMRFRRIPPSREDWVLAAILLAIHFAVFWAYWVRRQASASRGS